MEAKALMLAIERAQNVLDMMTGANTLVEAEQTTSAIHALLRARESALLEELDAVSQEEQALEQSLPRGVAYTAQGLPPLVESWEIQYRRAISEGDYVLLEALFDAPDALLPRSRALIDWKRSLMYAAYARNEGYVRALLTHPDARLPENQKTIDRMFTDAAWGNAPLIWIDMFVDHLTSVDYGTVAMALSTVVRSGYYEDPMFYTLVLKLIDILIDGITTGMLTTTESIDDGINYALEDLYLLPENDQRDMAIELLENIGAVPERRPVTPDEDYY